jgi:hypothetical protein
MLKVLATLAVLTTAANAQIIIPDQSRLCPKAVDLWINSSRIESEIQHLETVGACEGSCTMADLPQMKADAAALRSAARAAERVCGVGDQRGEALHVMLCGEYQADIQLDPDGHLGGSMEACPTR